jgi:hypothetical protein
MAGSKKCQDRALSLDRFAEKVPSFNFRNKGSMGTWFGLIISIFFWFMLIAFGITKLVRLVSGSNPLISAAP